MTRRSPMPALMPIACCLAFACSAIAAEPTSKVRLHEAQPNQAQLTSQILPPGPPAPSLVGPAWEATLTGPTVRFRWQPGVGQTTPVRYEVCVAELNQPCGGPTAMIYRPPPDVINIEPTVGQPTLNPKPGDPGFGHPPMSEGSAPPIHFLGAVLPPQFKGRRMQWWVTACVPDPRPRQYAPGTAPSTTPAEVCTASVGRPMSWVLSVPTLGAPAHNSVLSTLTDQFSWNVVDPLGIEHFLICFATRGTPCPAGPGIQPSVVVVQVPNAPAVPRTFTPAPGSLELNSMMGETLEWTVAACNASLGCTYQPARATFHVPIVEGSWDSMYALTQNEKCKNCHQMFADNATYQRHIALERFTWEENPTGRTPGGSKRCKDCHTAATGFANGWRFPSDVMTLDRARTDPNLCRVLKVNKQGHPPFEASTGDAHLLEDPLIRWAVDHIPGFGYAGLVQRFDKWTRVGRPCCSSPKPNGTCGTEPPHGQFGIAR